MANKPNMPLCGLEINEKKKYLGEPLICKSDYTCAKMELNQRTYRDLNYESMFFPHDKR